MTGETEKPHGNELRSFGRKRSRKPSPRQRYLMEDALPRLRLGLEALCKQPLPELFASPVTEVWLEVGFGGAEHLIHQASANPNVGLIGCEPFEDGVIKALTAIEQRGLRNVRLHPDDVRPLLRALPSACLSKAFILFPDPWPKTRHAKRRLVSKPFLDGLAEVMRPGAELRIATDIDSYARTVLEAAIPHPDFSWTARQPGDWRTPWPDWPGTRYEAKALREGRRPMFLTFIRA
ncbi:MAG: tRNA (guanine(46)-N(7))-methyltransferase TrmB [Hyphomicrobium sp.]